MRLIKNHPIPTMIVCDRLGQEVPSVTGLSTTVYVDLVKGKSRSDCGSNRKNPCKQFSTAAQQLDAGGIVHIIGDHVLSETIPLLHHHS